MNRPNEAQFKPAQLRSGVGPLRRRRRRGGSPYELEGPQLRADLSPVWEAARIDDVPEAPGFATLLRRDALFRRTLALADVTAALVALVIAVYLVGYGSVSLRPTAFLVVPFIVLVAKILGLYDRDQHTLRKTTIDEAPQILYLSVLYAMAVWLCEAILFHGWMARPQVFALTLASFVLIILGRSLARILILAVTLPERCVVLGNGVDAARITTKLQQTRSVNAEVIGLIALRAGTEEHPTSSLPNLGGFDALAAVVAQHEIERVIIAPGSDGEEEILDAIRLIKALGVKVSVLPRLMEVVGSSSSFDDIDGICLLGVRHYGLSKSSEFLKRTMDVIGAAAMLIVLAPLLIMLTLAVKLTSRGPVFFRQPRVGRKGAGFGMFKFRSMIDGADRLKDNLRTLNEAEGGLFKISKDPRVTSVGRFLRRTSLDELPQLLNVLKGDMSLVGPRPLVPDEDALIEGWRRRRLAVKPGMTGLWQIFGSSRIPMHEMVKIDYMYGANWSIWLDVKILLRTIPYMLGQRGL